MGLWYLKNVRCLMYDVRCYALTKPNIVHRTSNIVHHYTEGVPFFEIAHKPTKVNKPLSIKSSKSNL